mmetsp:Transcript_68938/g.166683  ORF Transcript_68938/g.166683 Transcript_68938/m.166683 type:complete len:219 (-) Transcript_68938:313-969(-)
MLLHRLAPTREGVLVDLVLDLLRRIRAEDGRGLIGGAHLRVGTLQRGEELGVDQRGLAEAEARRHVSCHAEVRVLVDGARDEAGHGGVAAEDVREGGRERRRRLHRREGVLADVDGVVEAEDALDLVVRGGLLYLEDVRVHVPDVVEVGEDERLRDVEAARDDVLCVLEGEAVALLQLEVLPQELLVVGHLHHQHALEDVLQVLGEHERDQVAEVQSL